MDRREAVLRELNLYPLWKRRGSAVSKAGNLLSAEAAVELTPPVLKQEVVPAVEAVEAAVPPVVAEKKTLSPSPPPAGGRGEAVVDSLNWPQLKQQVHDCTACKLRAGCTQTVFGVGDEQADWLFVGEGPGADEDALGEPFVGQAGKLLDNMLMAIKLERGKNVYIANIVKCRPPGNRTPEADEIATCLPYLHRQIELIQPKLIVALGKVASNALLGKEASIASLRGTLHEYRVPPALGTDVNQEVASSRPPPLMELPANRLGEQTTLAKSQVVSHQTTSSHCVRTSIPLIVTYHPAYLLRSPSEKSKAWQDLCLAVQECPPE